METSLDLERRAASEARDAAILLERKVISLSTEIEDVHGLLDAVSHLINNRRNYLMTELQVN